MYVGLLSMFALQAFGTPLSPQIYGTVLLTGALAAFGTAPVPSASLFMLAAVLSAVGVHPSRLRWWSASCCRSTGCST
jgi:Na+/H+-dicarboxylate symporter